jgi:uncharacterized protein (UPF0333 family)
MCDMECSVVGHRDPEQVSAKAGWRVNSISANTVALVGSHANKNDNNYYIIQEKDTSSLNQSQPNVIQFSSSPLFCGRIN